MSKFWTAPSILNLLHKVEIIYWFFLYKHPEVRAGGRFYSPNPWDFAGLWSHSWMLETMLMCRISRSCPTNLGKKRTNRGGRAPSCSRKVAIVDIFVNLIRG